MISSPVFYFSSGASSIFLKVKWQRFGAGCILDQVNEPFRDRLRKADLEHCPGGKGGKQPWTPGRNRRPDCSAPLRGPDPWCRLQTLWRVRGAQCPPIWPCRRVNLWCCWGLQAAARPPCCAPWPGWNFKMRGKSSTPGATFRACPRRSGTTASFSSRMPCSPT